MKAIKLMTLVLVLILTKLHAQENRPENILSGICLGVSNEIDLLNGVQFGLTKNETRKTRGLQMAIGQNVTDELKGCQIGLINKSCKVKGVQIGLWNVNEKRKLPLINWG